MVDAGEPGHTLCELGVVLAVQATHQIDRLLIVRQRRGGVADHGVQAARTV